MLPDLTLTTLAGDDVPLATYAGRVLLVVNVASHCGYTPQYEGLEALWRRYGDRGLTVLGFPCDQFGHQEPGTASEIQDFCTTMYSVTFPLFAKIDVNGPDTHPFYRYLKGEQPGVLGTTAIKWNFTKFAVARDGSVQGRFSPTTTPEALETTIERLLAAPRPTHAGSDVTMHSVIQSTHSRWPGGRRPGT